MLLSGLWGNVLTKGQDRLSWDVATGLKIFFLSLLIQVAALVWLVPSTFWSFVWDRHILAKGWLIKGKQRNETLSSWNPPFSPITGLLAEVALDSTLRQRHLDEWEPLTVRWQNSIQFIMWGLLCEAVNFLQHISELTSSDSRGWGDCKQCQ